MHMGVVYVVLHHSPVQSKRLVLIKKISERMCLHQNVLG